MASAAPATRVIIDFFIVFSLSKVVAEDQGEEQTRCIVSLFGRDAHLIYVGEVQVDCPLKEEANEDVMRMGRNRDEGLRGWTTGGDSFGGERYCRE